MTTMTVQQRVNNGAMFLDVAKPGWVRKINTETLRLSSHENCVLGQLYGGYTEGRVELLLFSEDVINMGFYQPDPPRRNVWQELWAFLKGEMSPSYHDLQVEWQRQIDIRMQAAVLA